MKTLSVIIVNYNSTEFTAKCLESLAGDKGIPDDWEVIVVDNGSSEYPNIQISKYPNVKTIKNETNVGFAKANNKAIKQSSGKYVFLLNPDTVVSQDTFIRLMSFMEEDERRGIVTPKVLMTDGRIDDASHRGFPTPWRAFCYFSGLSSVFPESMFFNGYHLGYQNLDKAHEIEACVGACMLIRRTAGQKVEWLDEDYFWYGEDLDFCYNIKEAGYQVWYVPDVSITHYKGVTSGIKKHSEGVSTASPKTKQKAQQARFEAMRIFYEKHYKDKYPNFLTSLVNTGISLLSKWHE